MSQVIISLTSYGARVASVSKVIMSLKEQEASFDKIVLWLDKDEFSNRTIPSDLSSLEDDYFEIKYTENIKSYKKLIPTLKEFHNSTIITFDDDIIISKDVVGKMLDAHRKYPNSIIANRGRVIKMSADGFESYSNWPVIKNDYLLRSKYCILPIGFGGVLYPPESLSYSVTDSGTFMSKADNADDIWFKLMALLKGTPVVLLPRSVTSSYRNLEGTQETALTSTVNFGDRNIEVAEAICSEFVELKSIFSKSDFDNISIDSDAYLDYQNRPKLFPSTNDAVTFFRKTADKIENIDLESSKLLIELALKYRPNGKHLKNKLRKYNEGK